MSKNMDVQIYPLEDRMDLAAKARRLMKAKRLTSAELAAEYWAAFADTNACMDDPDHFTYKTHAAIENTIHRFALLPHYDARSAS